MRSVSNKPTFCIFCSLKAFWLKTCLASIPSSMYAHAPIRVLLTLRQEALSQISRLLSMPAVPSTPALRRADRRIPASGGRRPMATGVVRQSRQSFDLYQCRTPGQLVALALARADLILLPFSRMTFPTEIGTIALDCRCL